MEFLKFEKSDGFSRRVADLGGDGGDDLSFDDFFEGIQLVRRESHEDFVVAELAERNLRSSSLSSSHLDAIHIKSLVVGEGDVHVEGHVVNVENHVVYKKSLFSFNHLQKCRRTS